MTERPDPETLRRLRLACPEADDDHLSRVAIEAARRRLTAYLDHPRHAWRTKEEPMLNTCIAYNTAGDVCREDGVAYDPDRGGMVCAEHRGPLRDATGVELREEPSIVLESMAAGELGVTATTRDLAQAELDYRRHRPAGERDA